MNKNQINRRKFLQYPTAGVVIAGSAGVVHDSDHISMNQTSVNNKIETVSEADVLVVGGGTAGTTAAIQSARAGATPAWQ